MTGPRHELAKRRRQSGHSQESLAELLEVSRSTIARWEAGESGMHPRQRVRLARALGVSAQELDYLLTGDTSPFQLIEEADPATLDLQHLALAAMAEFRSTDSRHGGGHLYDQVISYLSTTLAPHCFGLLGSSRSDVFAAAASITEMAGWMACEAGQITLADQHFARAHDLSTLSGDSQLQAHILASRMHLSQQVGQTKRARALANTGYRALAAGPQCPELAAKLLLIEAQAAAADGDEQRARGLVGRAEGSFGSSAGGAESPWLSPFDEASLANETAKCMHLLGEHHEAVRQAEIVLDVRPAERARSRAFAQLTMAQALAAKGQTDEARGVASTIVETTVTLQSVPVSTQLIGLRQTLGMSHDPPPERR